VQSVLCTQTPAGNQPFPGVHHDASDETIPRRRPVFRLTIGLLENGLTHGASTDNQLPVDCPPDSIPQPHFTRLLSQLAPLAYDPSIIVC